MQNSENLSKYPIRIPNLKAELINAPSEDARARVEYKQYEVRAMWRLQGEKEQRA